MKLDFAFFCNHATVASNGLFYVLEGGITTIQPEGFPAICPTLFLVTRLSFIPEERGAEFVCVAKVTVPDGAFPIPDSQLTVVPPLAESQAVPTFTAIYGFNNFVMGLPGMYRFRIFLDAVDLGGADLEVKAPQPSV